MKKKMKKLCLSALTVLICVSSASAEGTWTTYTTEDGLANNWVWSIAVDADNVKWFGTQGSGVSSFDGTTWTTYTKDDGLTNNDVYSIAVDADNVKWFGTLYGVSSFDKGAISVENTQDMPAVMDIRGNFPNPFNPFTTIEFLLNNDGFVTLDMFNISGQKVNTLFAKYLPAGVHSVIWDGRDANGSVVSSGIYFCRLINGDNTSVHRMLLVK